MLSRPPELRDPLGARPGPGLLVRPGPGVRGRPRPGGCVRLLRRPRGARHVFLPGRAGLAGRARSSVRLRCARLLVRTRLLTRTRAGHGAVRPGAGGRAGAGAGVRVRRGMLVIRHASMVTGVPSSRQPGGPWPNPDSPLSRGRGSVPPARFHRPADLPRPAGPAGRRAGGHPRRAPRGVVGETGTEASRRRGDEGTTRRGGEDRKIRGVSGADPDAPVPPAV
ncbi:hypothetical protein STXM2123_2776 [Streptomyces sp. F-3]|nr:hypothetical protein STXM2123_2776 [Streptomyces sp. F-3]